MMALFGFRARMRRAMKRDKDMTAKSAVTKPEDRPLSELQGRRLAALSGLDVKVLAGQSVAQLADKLRWQLDPNWLFFRRICGRVVKKDPLTGVEYGVPFATVFVEDTDCSFISYFPTGSRYVWHYPVFCHREVIGSVKTDACGYFCVLVPRFQIDWILRWRSERICFPIIFNRPNLDDLVRELPPHRVGPGPDPGPERGLPTFTPAVLRSLGDGETARLARELGQKQSARTLGASNQLESSLLSRRQFDRELPPPLPAEFRKALSGHGVVAAKGASAADGVRAAIAAKVGLDAHSKQLAKFDTQRFIGPFLRCFDILLPEWQLILDVPDITFRVTQDTDGDGNEETIYSEGYFDVRWNAGNLPNVTLVASSIAKDARFCSPRQPHDDCSTDPTIVTAGLMTVTDATYFDASNGYAIRPNRPSADGINPHAPNLVDAHIAQTPFCGAVQLYGCVDLQGAKYYRILHSVDNGGSYSAITGAAWNNYSTLDGDPIPISPDTNGWYEVNPIDPITHAAVPRANLEFPNMILDWTAPNGKNVVKISIANAAKVQLAESVPVALQVDNTAPSAPFDPSNWLAWKFAGDPDSTLTVLGLNCPLIQRGATPRDIEVVFRVTVSADHLRDATLGVLGCNHDPSSGPTLTFTQQPDPLNNPSHWYTTPTDNSVELYQRYFLDADAKPGCYTFHCKANSRAINPSGSNGENQIPPDWYKDEVYIYAWPSVSVAVVNEN